MPETQSPPSSHLSRRTFWGLFERRESWRLSWRGWIALTVALSMAAILLVARIYPFLAVTERADADILVVEGWIHLYAIRASVDEFRSGRYQRIYTTGGPVIGSGGYTNDFNTAASVGGYLLRGAGMPPDQVQMVPSWVMDRDRTYSSAVTLRKWFEEKGIGVRSMNVVTEDLHARRTRLLFQRAFGDGVKVGIIAVPNPDYDAQRWWRYSQGVRDVVTESVGYAYAKLFGPRSGK
ncbi:MAG: ElyC/SanA/YdcF family protein [Chthoniobacteraceae bacterium]